MFFTALSTASRMVGVRALPLRRAALLAVLGRWLAVRVFAIHPGRNPQRLPDVGFSVPLAIWTTLRALAGEVGRRRYVVIMAPLLVVQFLMSLEVFATIALFAAIATALAYRLAQKKITRRCSRRQAQLSWPTPSARWLCCPASITCSHSRPRMDSSFHLGVSDRPGQRFQTHEHQSARHSADF